MLSISGSTLNSSFSISLNVLNITFAFRTSGKHLYIDSNNKAVTLSGNGSIKGEFKDSI